LPTFDFISTDEFRASLEKDGEELIACLRAGAWKAALVIAGSLIQAILVEYLLASDKGSEDELVSLSFSDLLERCKAERVLSPRTVDLASFLRPYLDFLSPSRHLRPRATTDETSARIAQALLEIVINEVSGHKREHYPRTAEQIAAKLQSDPSSAPIIGHLLEKMSSIELERLLVELLPKLYFESVKVLEPRTEETLARIEQCYRLAFEIAPVELKRTVAGRFLSILENESEFVVRSYESRFFRGSDLEFLDEGGRAVVLAHFFASLAKQASVQLAGAAAGMGRFLATEEDTRSFFVPLVMNLFEGTDEALAAAILKRISEEYKLLSESNRRSVGSWIGRLKWSVRQEGHPPRKAMEGLESALSC